MTWFTQGCICLRKAASCGHAPRKVGILDGNSGPGSELAGQACLLAEAQHQVQILDCDAGGALAQVVEDAHQQDMSLGIREDMNPQTVGVVERRWSEIKRIYRE